MSLFLELKTFFVDFIIENFLFFNQKTSKPESFPFSHAKIHSQNLSSHLTFYRSRKLIFRLPIVVLFPMMQIYNSFLNRFIMGLVQEMVAMCLSKNYHYPMCIQLNKKEQQYIEQSRLGLHSSSLVNSFTYSSKIY